MAEEVLKALEDLESYSFYGLCHWLSTTSDLLDQIDDIAVAKAPKAQELALAEQKDELLNAQTQLRRQMGAILEEPVTSRERPKAKEFLEGQVQKLLSQGKGERVASAVGRLQDLLRTQLQRPAALESKEVRELETQMKQAEVQWKELEPIYVKWQAGRHSFKSNADLQSFKRRYEEAKKIRDTAPDRLESLLRRRRVAEAAAPVPAPRQAPAGAGWAAAARKAPVKAAPSVANARGAAAMALDQPKPKAKSSWTKGVTLAQRLRAEAAAQVRDQDAIPAPSNTQPHHPAGPEPSNDDDFFWEETVRPPAPPVPVAAAPAPQEFITKSKGKAPPAAPKKASLASLANGGRRWGRAEVVSANDDDAEESGSEVPEEPPAAEPEEKIYTASAKKKGKRKKKGEEKEEDDTLQAKPGSAKTSAKSDWVLTLQAALANTVLEDLLRRESWSFEEGEAESRLASLAQRLQSPLGFHLPFTWSLFLALDLDGGPKRRSRRGQSDALERLRHNVPRLLPFYLTLVFLLVTLHSLSHFGWLTWIMAAHTALLLLPAGGQVANFKASTHVQTLQVVHLLLWIFFIRSLWQMHIFIKVFCVVLAVGHAYSVTEVGKDDM